MRSVYVENVARETTHLAADEFATATRCGREIRPDWVWGDETLSGLVVTCKKCRQSHWSLVRA